MIGRRGQGMTMVRPPKVLQFPFNLGSDKQGSDESDEGEVSTFAFSATGNSGTLIL